MLIQVVVVATFTFVHRGPSISRIEEPIPMMLPGMAQKEPPVHLPMPTVDPAPEKPPYMETAPTIELPSPHMELLQPMHLNPWSSPIQLPQAEPLPGSEQIDNALHLIPNNVNESKPMIHLMPNSPDATVFPLKHN